MTQPADQPTTVAEPTAPAETDPKAAAAAADKPSESPAPGATEAAADPAPEADADAKPEAEPKLDAPAANGDKPESAEPQTDGPGDADADADAEAEKDNTADLPMVPESDLSRSVAAELSDTVSELFRKGEHAAQNAGTEVAKIEAANSLFVKALEAVPEEKQTTVSFAEIALMYGRTLVRLIEESGSSSSKLVNKVVKAAVAGITGADLGLDNGADENGKPDDKDKDTPAEGDAKTEEKKEDGDTKAVDSKPEAGASAAADADSSKAAPDGDDGDEEDLDDSKDEDEDAETAWQNIESARIIFEREGKTQRVAFCRTLLGDLMLASDEGKQAAAEFDKASELYEDGRDKSACLHKRYLALRIEDKPEAARALRKSVDAYAALDDAVRDDATLEEMRSELKEIELSVKENAPAAQKDETVTVVAVKPKRKRDVENADKPADDVKKARVEEPVGR